MTSIFDPTPATDLTDDQLAERLIGYASQMAALTARFLDHLAAFDTRHGWSGHGILSCAHWLSWKTSLSLRTAQEHLRIAHTLENLPLTHAAFTAGTLSYSKIRALTRVSTPDHEEELVRFAHSATAAHTERMCAAMRTLDHLDHQDPDAEDTAPPPASGARRRWNDDGTLTITAKLTAVDGAHLLAATVRAEYDRTRTATDPALPDPPTSENADTTADENADTASGEHPAADDAHRHTDLWANVPRNIAPALVAMADAVIDAPPYRRSPPEPRSSSTRPPAPPPSTTAPSYIPPNAPKPPAAPPSASSATPPRQPTPTST
ncbi:hypothetical protein [Tsukamurella soli]